MNKSVDDLLIEIQTEELPPKNLLILADAFCAQVKERLEKAALSFAGITSYATPRRLALIVNELAVSQPDQTVERKGPAVNAAFDKEGKPTPACEGFARSCGVTVPELKKVKTEQGEWMAYAQAVKGKETTALIPVIVEQSLAALPIAKRMRWGAGDAQFVRPVQSVILLFGEQAIDATILNCKTGRETSGHRFMAPGLLSIPRAKDYVSLLETKGHVMADVSKRRALIREQANECLKKAIGDKGCVLISSDALLDEVTGLVEWPTALCGQFDAAFLTVPDEVLISSMQDHQRYFPVVDAAGKLLPYFVTISNIDSRDAKRVIHGNERVLRARLSDAAFFYETDKKESLAARLPRLKDILFQAKLGTLHDKADRLSKLAALIAGKMNADTNKAARAGLLAKTDLTTNMVGEFPELQGVMGTYYARHDGEDVSVAEALSEQYLPRFAGDALPKTPIGQALALADRIDTLIGAFGIHQLPTGDKDPYGLRRAALGVLRILIEKQIHLPLREVLEAAFNYYAVSLSNANAVNDVLVFIQERLRFYYQEQGVTPDVIAAVVATGMSDPFDMHARICAVQVFKQLTEAETLSVANKRVSNILAKYETVIDAKDINPVYFEHAVEQELARQLEAKQETVVRLCQQGQYNEVLLELAGLRKPVDDFFEQVMVMTDDKSRRENRLLLLMKLRALFLQVADIALLQS